MAASRRQASGNENRRYALVLNAKFMGMVYAAGGAGGAGRRPPGPRPTGPAGARTGPATGRARRVRAAAAAPAVATGAPCRSTSSRLPSSRTWYDFFASLSVKLSPGSGSSRNVSDGSGSLTRTSVTSARIRCTSLSPARVLTVVHPAGTQPAPGCSPVLDVRDLDATPNTPGGCGGRGSRGSGPIVSPRLLTVRGGRSIRPDRHATRFSTSTTVRWVTAIGHGVRLAFGRPDTRA